MQLENCFIYIKEVGLTPCRRDSSRYSSIYIGQLEYFQMDEVMMSFHLIV